jgi:hypothetical protein
MGGGNSHQRAVQKTANKRIEKQVSTMAAEDPSEHNPTTPAKPEKSLRSAWILFNHFKAALAENVGEFCKSPSFLRGIMIGVLGILFSALHFRPPWNDAWGNLIAWVTPLIWMILLFAILICIRTTRQLWYDASSRVRLLWTSVILISICLGLGTLLGIFAYTTAALPPKSSQELVEFGPSITVRIVIQNPGPSTNAPEWTTLATGFWVSNKGYVVTCYDKVQERRDLRVAVPFPHYLGGPEVTGAFETLTSAVIWKDEQSNIAVLRVIYNPFDAHTVVVRKSVQLFVPELEKGLPKNTHNSVLQFGFALTNPVSFDPQFGYLTTDSNPKGHSQYALFLSVPFKVTDCGATLINDRGMVIGMAEDVDIESHTIAIPSMNIRNLLKMVDMTH